MICSDCGYCGDKYSFPLPNDLNYTDTENPFIKRYYCCCGDNKHYMKDITGLNIGSCEDFEEI